MATALLLALTLINSGKPAKAVDVGHDRAIVVMVGRPGCTAEALGGDPSNPVIVCRKPTK